MRLRIAHGLTLDEVAAALKVRAAVSGWESVKKPTEPRGPEREAARLLRQLAEFYPARPPPEVRTRRCPRRSPVPPIRTEPPNAGKAYEAAAVTATENTQAPAPARAPVAAAPAAAARPARTARPSST
jgi:transcriptional regulator with XRE-family HTH domain